MFYSIYSTFVLLITISDPCPYVILNDIAISYYYLLIVLMLVTDNVYLSYILYHICMSWFCVIHIFKIYIR